MNNDQDEPIIPFTPVPLRARHDGWTPDRIATFLETLADTGIVSEAVRVAGMHRDSAYSLRTRDAVFAAAWRAAQAHARPLVADGLLERSITGTVELHYRDGVLVGERRHYESWLGLAVLKRLDKQAEEDRRAQHVRGISARSMSGEHASTLIEHDDAGNALAARMAGNWPEVIDALRSGGTAAVPALLDAKADKADTPPSPPGDDPSEDCWRNDEPHAALSGGQCRPDQPHAALSGGQCRPDHGVWMTSFPPPPAFDGEENAPWDGFNYYERACTPEEAALLDANEAAAEAKERAELTADAEARRDSWFAGLREALQPMAPSQK